MSRSRFVDGVTLVEVMMTLFIMALATTLIVTTLPARSPAAQEEAQRLAEVADRARRAAMVNGQTIGIRANGKGYTVVQWEAEGWRPLLGSTHRFARGVTLDLAPFQAVERERPEKWPQAWFGPLGHTSEARFELEANRVVAVVTIDALGAAVEVQ